MIANIRGNSGIINQSANADKKKLTSEEKEAVQWAAAQAVADETNKSGVIADKTKIQEKLNTYIGDADSKKFEYNIYGPGDTYINKILTADIYVVKFQNTGNAYIIDETGNVRLDEDSSGIVDRDGVLINPGSISINREPTGKYYELTITSNTKDYKVTCSDESVLDVKKDKNGKILVENNKIFVRGKELGKATILVETSKEKRAMSYVTVHQEPTSIELTASGHILDISSAIKSLQIKPTIYPSTANYKTGIKWTSSNNDIAVVDENGFVTGISNGDVTITATTANGKSTKATITVQTSPTSITLSTNKIVLEKYTNKNYQLKAIVRPTNANVYTNVSWTSSNNGIVTVNGNGYVTAIGTGTATITATTGNGLSAKCTVVVENKVQRITASPNSAAIKVGDTFTSKITCSPSDTTEQIVCVNSNSKVISTNMIASGNGTYNLTVNGIAIGNATITIKNSSSTVYAQISVNVGLHISRGWSDAGAVSSGWKQLGDVINNTACSTIKSIKGSANIGANSMWSDRYFGLRIMALDTSGNWVEIWSRYSGTFTWNFGKDRYYSADISLTPNKVYYSFALQFMYSTNVDSGGAKYSNFSIDIGT